MRRGARLPDPARGPPELQLRTFVAGVFPTGRGSSRHGAGGDRLAGRGHHHQRRGARVIGTAGAANQDCLTSLGATALVYGDSLVERVRAVAPQGVDAVFDAAGKGAGARTGS